jgi:hypothetical protein
VEHEEGTGMAGEKRSHYASAKDVTLRVPIAEGENYVNSYDNLIPVGKYTRREWEDIKQAVERHLLQLLKEPGDAVKKGTNKFPGIIHEIVQYHGLTEYTILKAIEELGPKFRLQKVLGNTYVVRFL